MPNLLDLLADAVTTRGGFVFEDGRTASSATLWELSARSAAWLCEHIGTGGTVAAVLSACPEAVAFLLGALRGGVTFASLPHPSRSMGVRAYVRQLEELAALVGADVLAVEASYVPGLDSKLRVCSFEQTVAAPARRSIDNGGAELVQFSSGTTAAPKGIRLDLEAIGTNVAMILDVLGPGAGDSSLSWLPLSHDMGLVGMLLAPWASGAPRHAVGHGRAFLLRPESFLARPLDWLRHISAERVTITAAPCFALDLVLRRARHDRLSVDLSCVRALIVGAEPVRAETLRAFARHFAPYGLRPDAIAPGYGLAEATLAVAAVRPGERWRSVWLESTDGIAYRCSASAAPSAAEYVSCGRPMPDTDVRVRNGTIEIRSPSLCRSYVDRPAPLTDDGWFTTEDIGFLDGDDIVPVGRRDDVVIVRGRSFDAQRCAAVAEGVLPVRPGTACAFVDSDGALVLAAESAATTTWDGRAGAGRLEAARRAVLEHVGVAQDRLLVVEHDALPKTPSGKPRRWAVRELYEAGTLPILRAFNWHDAR